MNRKIFISTLLASAISACKRDDITPPATSPPTTTDPNNTAVLKTINLQSELLNVGDAITDSVKGIYVKRVAVANSAISFICYSLACTHSGCIVALQANGEFHCPCHGSKFHNDGTVLNGPAARPLDRFTLEIQGTDLLVKRF